LLVIIHKKSLAETQVLTHEVFNWTNFCISVSKIE